LYQVGDLFELNVKLRCLKANDVMQSKIHTAEPLVPDPSAFEIELAI